MAALGLEGLTWDNLTWGTLASGIVVFFVRNLLTSTSAGDKLREDLMAMNRQLNDQVKEANSRADRFAAERSEAQRKESEALIRASAAEKEAEHLQELLAELADRCPNEEPLCGARKGG